QRESPIRSRRIGPIVSATADHIVALLVADPTMTSPVVVSTPGTQPSTVQPPPVRLCRYTCIRFTVRPLERTPSPVGSCSLSTTYPTPGKSIRVFGAIAPSPDVT